MSVSIRHNATSFASANILNRTQRSMQSTLKKVASGNRISRPGDDAAGSAVSVNLSTQANSTLTAIRNARDGQAMLQTSEAALNEVVNLLDRARELAVQSSSETLEDEERQYINTEFSAIKEEVKRISLNGKFNDQTVVTGSTYEVQVGTEDSKYDRISLQMGNVKNAFTGLDPVSLADTANAQSGITRIDSVLVRINTDRARLGALYNRLDNAIANAESKHESLSAAASSIQDADMAFETSQMTALQVKQQAGAAAMSQANQLPSSVIQLI